MTPEEAARACAEEALRKGFIPDNPQLAFRMRRVAAGEPIDEKEVLAEGGADHLDPTLRSTATKPAISKLSGNRI